LDGKLCGVVGEHCVLVIADKEIRWSPAKKVAHFDRNNHSACRLAKTKCANLCDGFYGFNDETFCIPGDVASFSGWM
jgi:hypothetical protein